MAFKKIDIKKSALTLTSAFIIIMIVCILFFLIFGAVDIQMKASSQEYDNSTLVQAAFNNVSQSLVNIKGTTDKMSDGYQNITEPTSAFSVAIGGFQALGAVLKLPFEIFTFTKSIFHALLTTIPWGNIGLGEQFESNQITLSWILTLLLTGVGLFLLIGIAKGEPKM
tara:strand:- start:592 stop:1095 length:504 start_codon:yes stop_codon:yes gene_type:complete